MFKLLYYLFINFLTKMQCAAETSVLLQSSWPQPDQSQMCRSRLTQLVFLKCSKHVP